MHADKTAAAEAVAFDWFSAAPAAPHSAIYAVLKPDQEVLNKRPALLRLHQLDGSASAQPQRWATHPLGGPLEIKENLLGLNHYFSQAPKSIGQGRTQCSLRTGKIAAQRVTAHSQCHQQVRLGHRPYFGEEQAERSSRELAADDGRVHIELVNGRMLSVFETKESPRRSDPAHHFGVEPVVLFHRRRPARSPLPTAKAGLPLDRPPRRRLRRHQRRDNVTRAPRRGEERRVHRHDLRCTVSYDHLVQLDRRRGATLQGLPSWISLPEDECPERIARARDGLAQQHAPLLHRNRYSPR